MLPSSVRANDEWCARIRCPPVGCLEIPEHENGGYTPSSERALQKQKDDPWEGVFDFCFSFLLFLLVGI